MDDKETKEWLIGLLLVGFILAMGSIIMEKKLELVTGVLTSKPKFIKIPKASKYEFSIQEDTINKYDLRYVFSDLSKNQKKEIRNEVEVGDLIEMHIDRDDLYRNGYEMYSLKINGKDIYKLDEFRQLEEREKIGSFGLIISSIFCWFLFLFTKFKGRNSLIFGLQLLGLIAFVMYLMKG